jgi:hypothetical protein
MVMVICYGSMSSISGGGGGAPTTSQYVVGAADATLTNELVLGTSVIMSGTLAARPAASLAGREYFATDDNGGTLYRDSGSAWVAITIPLAFMLANDISPPQLTANQNDYAPAGIAAASVVRLDMNANINITGWAGSNVDGSVLIVENTTTTRTLILQHENAGSAAANRMLCPGAQDVQLQPLCSAVMIYDSTSARWRVLDMSRQLGSNIVNIGTANNGGISPNLPREDHVHAHPVFASGDLHSEYVQEALGTTKGDLIVFTASATPSRLAVGGTNGMILAVNSAQATGLEWRINPVIWPFSQPGTLVTGVGKFFIYNDTGMTLRVVSIRVRVNTAPTGATLIIDVNKNGTTIYTTQANRPTVAISGTTVKSTNPDVTDFADGDNMSIDIDQVGSTVAGADMTVTVTMKVV